MDFETLVLQGLFALLPTARISITLKIHCFIKIIHFAELISLSWQCIITVVMAHSPSTPYLKFNVHNFPPFLPNFAYMQWNLAIIGTRVRTRCIISAWLKSRGMAGLPY